MSSLNLAQLIGNLGQDPDVRSMPNGKVVANLSVATSESWKSKETGERKEKTEWNRVAVFGQSADFASKYLKKGSKVYVAGKLQTRKWTDKQGADRYTTEIVVQDYGGTLMSLETRSAAKGAGGAQQDHDHAPSFNVDIPF